MVDAVAIRRISCLLAVDEEGVVAFVAMKCVHNARLDAELVVVRAAVQEVFVTVHYGEVVVSGVSVELVTVAVCDDETVGSIIPREGVVVTVRNGERAFRSQTSSPRPANDFSASGDGTGGIEGVGGGFGGYEEAFGRGT